MSGFYKVAVADVPPGSSAGDGDLNLYVIFTDGVFLWIQTAQDPHPLEGMIPATKLGSSWQEVWAAASADVRALFIASVRRDGERLRVAYADVLPDDEIVFLAGPHRFMGEPPERFTP